MRVSTDVADSLSPEGLGVLVPASLGVGLGEEGHGVPLVIGWGPVEQQLVGTIDSGFVGSALYGRCLAKAPARFWKNGLFIMNRYCCGTVLVVRLADVLRGAGKSNNRKNGSELIRSPLRLMVA